MEVFMESTNNTVVNPVYKAGDHNITKITYDMTRPDGSLVVHDFMITKEKKKNIAGYLKNKCSLNIPAKTKSLHFTNEKINYYASIFKNKGLFRTIEGYVPIGNGEYIAITKKRKKPFVAAVIMATVFMISGTAVIAQPGINIITTFVKTHIEDKNPIISNESTGGDENNIPSENIQITSSSTENNLVVDERATIERRDPYKALSNRQVYYAGIEDCTVNKNTVIYLENLEDNGDILMKYDIYVGDEKVFETDLIPSGNHVEWKPSDSLKSGKTYKINLQQTPYYPLENGEYLSLTSPINTVNITIL